MQHRMSNLTRWQDVGINRLLGIGFMLAGVFAITSPFFLGTAVLYMIGILFLIAGGIGLVESIRGLSENRSFLNYLQNIGVMPLGILLLFSPRFVLSGLIFVVSLFCILNGIFRIYTGTWQRGAERLGNLYNGVFIFILGIAIWYFVSANLGLVAVSVVLGLWLISEGWQRFLRTEQSFAYSQEIVDFHQHLDQSLALTPSPIIEQLQRQRFERHGAFKDQYMIWGSMFLVIFFVIHLFRTGGNLSIVGLITPVAAALGDVLMALLIALLLVLPLRLLWRRLSRPLERNGWRYLIERYDPQPSLTASERLLERWLLQRLDVLMDLHAMRTSLNYAFWRLFSLGVPLTAIVIAVNSIWGFSWYFNSENWASAVWQKLTETRVDNWRQAMAEAVEEDALARGIPADQIFTIQPAGLLDGEDFSFIVIGDPGEGDESQRALMEPLINLGREEAIKFMLIASDIIYPDGKLRDYEKNFYLPFKGFTKPIYAIPGNHDWFDANHGFNANFLEGNAARISMQARQNVDSLLDNDEVNPTFIGMIDEAARLRALYRIQNGLQRSSYFDLHTQDFSLITLDTGILKTLDEKQRQWLEASLQRASDNFKFVVLGHPLYAAGYYQGEHNDSLAEIHQLLRQYNVDVVMGGDTHDFEFYREDYQEASEERQMLHFVNGGGGAYLSIGTALDYPETPATADFAFYPSTEALRVKLEQETPLWKQPVLFWIKQFAGYPLSVETLSGIFDFNNAPFFQSFMEISVERSKKQVRMRLYGVDGPLRWRDLEIGGQVKPVEHMDDDVVEFIVPL